MSISNLIFTACVACKNQVQNRQEIKFKNQFREIEILKNQVQIDRGNVGSTEHEIAITFSCPQLNQLSLLNAIRDLHI